MNKLELKEIIYLSLVAAIYVALTWIFMPIAYGPIQFRFSEAVVLLALYKRKYIAPLIIGVFIANLMSPSGWVDVVVGTLATAASVISMHYLYVTTKRKFLAAFMPVIINAVMIGVMLTVLYDLPLFLTMFQVGLGQFVVIMIVGLAIFRNLERNEFFAIEVLGLEKAAPVDEKLPFINIYNTIGLALVIIVTVLFYMLPLYTQAYDPENRIYFTLNFFRIEDGLEWLRWTLMLPILNIISLTFIKKSWYKGIPLLIVGLALFLVPVIQTIILLSTTVWPTDINFVRVAIYFIVLTLLFATHIYKYKNEK